MARVEKCGIYMIRCETTGDFYIGSSVQMHRRWSQHRAFCRSGKSGCLRLQRAWKKYGEKAFTFHILEECSRDLLLEREQHFFDTMNPTLNIVRDAARMVSDSHVQELVEFNRKRFAAITHCPRGHVYDEANTYINKKGKRICRACNALRVAAVYASETPEQTRARLNKCGENYRKNLDERRAKQKQYMATRKAEKREYDRQRREQLKAQGVRRRKKAKATVSIEQMSMF